jgi:hypothetical protein
VCTKVDFAKGTCPSGSLIGQAEVTTPLLDQPLKGSVYLRASQHELPDMVLDLKGQFDIEASGRVDSVNGRLRTTFETVPDTPVSKIVLDLLGGGKGLLVNSDTLCGRKKKATVRMTGQNGAVIDERTELQENCAAKSRHKRRVSHRREVR